MTSHFFAFFSKLRWISRWSLKRNSVPENVMEHTASVAAIAHMLAVIRVQRFGGTINPDRVATVALFHDLNEVVTGDMPSPVKYHSPGITRAYKEIEALAQREIHGLLPDDIQPHYRPLLIDEHVDPEVHELVKAADIIDAYFKCKVEIAAGNPEFALAARDLEQRVTGLKAPEAAVFLEIFGGSLGLTLDELMLKK